MEDVDTPTTRSTTTLQEQLEQLGDPSGRHDGAYWNGWFETVCRDRDHCSFEWYCSVAEVVRIVQEHRSRTSISSSRTTGTTGDSVVRAPTAMIHPGSGTSLVPLELRTVYPTCRQVVVDVAHVAIEEMQLVHDKHCRTSKAADGSNHTECSRDDDDDRVVVPMDYIVSDLLAPSSAMPPATLAMMDSAAFDVWIDKGFVDAVFAKDHDCCGDIPERLFHRACTCLKPAVGFAMIVSLAEDHSLKIILDNWISTSNTGWDSTLHVWEVEPTSGTLPPFAFVLTKRESSSSSDNDNHNSNSNNHDRQERRLTWHKHDRTVDDRAFHCDDAFFLVQRLVAESREAFRARTAAAASSSMQQQQHQVLATIEIKPYDANADLEKLGRIIRTRPWMVGKQQEQGSSGDGSSGGSGDRSLHPSWVPVDDGKTAALQAIVPIGFGISKLKLRCAIASSDLDDLLAVIEDWEGGNDFEDGVQSVDVGDVFPIGNMEKLLKRSSG